MSNQQLRITIGLRLNSQICEKLECICGKDVTEDGCYGLSCLKGAGRLSRHSNLNTLIKQGLTFISIPSVLEPRHHRKDQKRPEGLTLIPWTVGGQLLWAKTVVDSPVTSKLSAGSVCISGMVVTEAEAEDRKSNKFRN